MPFFYKKDFLNNLKNSESKIIFAALFLCLLLFFVNFIHFNFLVFLISSGILVILILFLFVLLFKLSSLAENKDIITNQIDRIISNIKVGVIIYDKNFKILMFNKAAYEIFDINEDITGKILSTDMMKNKKFQILIQTVFPSLAPTVVEMSEPGKYPQTTNIIFDNPERNLVVVTDRIYNKKGEIISFIKIITDKTRERELLNSKTEFISVAAHQLRTPLTTVNWTLESIADSKNLSSEEKDIVQNGLIAAKRMLDTVNDLLDVSKIEEGKFGYDFKKVNLEEFLNIILSQNNAIAKQYGIKMYFKRPDKPIYVTIDEQKMSMAILNLIDNAIKYNVKNGEITVSAKLYNDNPRFALVSIKDTGVGISDEDKNKIFQKFYRSERIKKIAPDGTGLGLYIVKNIINRHGGKIWFESEINRGTTFYVTIPINDDVIPKSNFLF